MADAANLGVPTRGGVELPERYLVRGRIARGGMAVVWHAEDLLLGREVAIKLLSDPYAHDPAAINRFMREARAAARLSKHPHVATTYDVAEATQPQDATARAFIVMEYLPGGTVADALRTGEIRPGEPMRWLREAASALDYAHRHGVIHRDIKPANFLLDADRVLHVADFGIARLGTEDTITATGQMLGTAFYLAPERALGRPAIDASDRYALAVAAYELLVGERPFAAEHFTAQAQAHVEDPPPAASERNPALPAAVDPVLARGMAKRPEERWPTAESFATALDHALSARDNAGWRRTTYSRRPRRGPAVAPLIAAVLAIAVAAVLASQQSSPSPAKHSRRLTFNVGHARPRHPRQPRSATAGATPTTTVSRSPNPTAPASSQPSATALEARGHQLMEAGNYRAAIPVLRRAVAAANPSSLTYAYALFDLGRSLRLAGDPQAAIPILRRRVEIPNQTGLVRQELLLAERAAGQQPASSGGATRAPGNPPPQNGRGAHGPGRHHGRGPGHDGHH